VAKRRRSTRWKTEDYLKWGLIAYVFIQVILPMVLVGGLFGATALAARRGLRRLPDTGAQQPPFTTT
jgi:hypothetical protein